MAAVCLAWTFVLRRFTPLATEKSAFPTDQWLTCVDEPRNGGKLKAADAFEDVAFDVSRSRLG
jgi:hypothetical protein